MFSHDIGTATCVSGSDAWDASAWHAAISCDEDGNDNKIHAHSIDVTSGNCWVT